MLPGFKKTFNPTWEGVPGVPLQSLAWGGGTQGGDMGSMGGISARFATKSIGYYYKGTNL